MHATFLVGEISDSSRAELYTGIILQLTKNRQSVFFLSSIERNAFATDFNEFLVDNQSRINKPILRGKKPMIT